MKDIRQQWKTLADTTTIKKEDIAALCCYRAMVKDEGIYGALSRLHKAFKPITNKIKLENGAVPSFALKNALCLVKYSRVYRWIEISDAALLEALAKEANRNIA